MRVKFDLNNLVFTLEIISTGDRIDQEHYWSKALKRVQKWPGTLPGKCQQQQ